MRFHRIGHSSDIPVLEGRGATVGGVRVAVFRCPGGWFALGGHCPHRGGPLEDGLVADACVTCPLHNWRVDLRTGRVIAGGEGMVAIYELHEHDGELFLAVDADGVPIPMSGPALEQAA